MTVWVLSPATKFKTVRVPIASLFRLSTRPLTEPYFGRRGNYRFDSTTGKYGVLYCAGSPITAFAESVLHSAADKWDAKAQAYVVSRSEIAQRTLVTFKHPDRTHIVMADLTGEALKRLNLNNDISAGPSYVLPQRISEQVHAQSPLIDGIQYVSRQHNTSLCYAVFDRSGLIKDTQADLNEKTIKALCRRFNVTSV